MPEPEQQRRHSRGPRSTVPTPHHGPQDTAEGDLLQQHGADRHPDQHPPQQLPKGQVGGALVLERFPGGRQSKPGQEDGKNRAHQD